MEGLLDDIACHIDPTDSARAATPENRRALLASDQIGFLSVDRKEWTPDGKNFVNGLMKILHPEGSHPGLSDEDHSTFRLHAGHRPDVSPASAKGRPTRTGDDRQGPLCGLGSDLGLALVGLDLTASMERCSASIYLHQEEPER